MIEAGVATVAITPPAGLAMAGFGARTLPATGAHDPLTVRALAVGDTALAVADVIGIDAALSDRVRSACGLPRDRVIVAATHTHGGPVSMEGRLGAESDPAFLARLEEGLVAAIRAAAASRRPVRLSGGTGTDPGAGRNRRHAGGPVDGAVPVLRLDRADDGRPLAILVSYGCHPVVLGADNRLWTADYPHFVRGALEAALPGAVAIFATGCPGDVNTGHSAAASLSLAADPARSFAAAGRIGGAIAAAALAAPLSPLGTGIAAAEARVALDFLRREADLPALAAAWEAEARGAEPLRAHLLGVWLRWIRGLPDGMAPLPARVSALDWGGARILALPGEIFAATALGLRASQPGAPLFVLGYADDNPGYIPPREEFAHGGYEVDEAHRFYGLPATFAPGSAEALAAAVAGAAGSLPQVQTTNQGVAHAT